MAEPVLLEIVYMLTCRILGLAVLMFRSDQAKNAELLVVRHENAVLRRHVSLWGSITRSGLALAGSRPEIIAE